MANLITAGNATNLGTVISSDTSGVLQLQSGSTPTTAITVDTSQNVGIGTSSPSAKAQIGDTTVVSTNRLVFGKSQTSSETNLPAIGQKSVTGVGNDLALAGTSTSSTIRFYTGISANSGEIGTGSNTERMQIDPSGNLLVGYTLSNGSYKLQVNSQIFATSSTIATSDAKYKTNVKPLENALTLVNKLNPVSFNWTQHPIHAFDTNNTTVGFLAQEVQSALSDTSYVNSVVKESVCTITPEVKDEDGNVTTPAVTEPFLGIAEGNMISILTKAIQELSAQVTALQAQVTALQGAK